MIHDCHNGLYPSDFVIKENRFVIYLSPIYFQSLVSSPPLSKTTNRGIGILARRIFELDLTSIVDLRLLTIFNHLLCSHAKPLQSNHMVYFLF
jgi:hypothetical protein